VSRPQTQTPRRRPTAALAGLLALVLTWPPDSGPAAAETARPSPQTATPGQPAAGTTAKPADSGPLLGPLKLPDLELPKVPSLMEVWRQMDQLPEQVGLPRVNHVIDRQFDQLIGRLDTMIPVIESLGFQVRNFDIDWTLPPTIKVRLESTESATDEEYQKVLAQVRGDLVLESIVLSLGGVRRIQSASNLAPFKRALIEVDLSLPPHVVMSFSDPTNQFAERFRGHRENLRSLPLPPPTAAASSP